MNTLDLELERCGWTARSRLFDEMIEAARRHDDAAFDAAKHAFWKSSREAGSAQEAPARNHGH